MMYQDIYNCICQNTKKMKIYYPVCQTYSQTVFQKSFFKRWTNMQEASGWSTTPNVARTISCKAWYSPAEYPSWVARCDIKGSNGTMLNPIFWNKVQGQKHPGRWGIVEHQIPGIKVLLETNAKSHKHLGIKLSSSESKTQLVNQRKQNSYRRSYICHSSSIVFSYMLLSIDIKY